MSKSTVYWVQVTPLPISETVAILKNPPAAAISNIPPAKPKGGEIYIFQSNDDAKQGSYDDEKLIILITLYIKYHIIIAISLHQQGRNKVILQLATYTILVFHNWAYTVKRK